MSLRSSSLLSIILTGITVAAPSAAVAQSTPAADAATATAAPAPGGRPQTRQGFYIGFGFGAGSAKLHGDANGESRWGFAGHFKIGGALSQNLLLGAETNGFIRNESGVDYQIATLLAVLQAYPSATSGFWIKGGVGLSTVSLDDGTDRIEATGAAGSIGLGYDVRTGRNFSLVPQASYTFSTGAEAKANGVRLGADVNPAVFQIGLGVMWH